MRNQSHCVWSRRIRRRMAMTSWSYSLRTRSTMYWTPAVFQTLAVPLTLPVSSVKRCDEGPESEKDLGTCPCAQSNSEVNLKVRPRSSELRYRSRFCSVHMKPMESNKGLKYFCETWGWKVGVGIGGLGGLNCSSDHILYPKQSGGGCVLPGLRVNRDTAEQTLHRGDWLERVGQIDTDFFFKPPQHALTTSSTEPVPRTQAGSTGDPVALGPGASDWHGPSRGSA